MATQFRADCHMEEGEIPDQPTAAPQTYDYDPSLEWRGEECEYSQFREPTKVLRLIRQMPSQAATSGRIALIDGHEEVQFGRDALPSGSLTPRIRIKTMEVSKHHATIYWDTERNEWAIVDMGSMHGTFVRPSTSTESKGQRLSAARTASIPRVLSHLDSVCLGSTCFTVHIHSEFPCEECSPRALNDEILLFPPTSRTATKGAIESKDGRSRSYSRDVRDPRKALSALKKDLLEHHLPPPSKDRVNTSYTDRSARRRAMFPSSTLDAPGVPMPSVSTRETTPSAFTLASMPPAPEPVSQPAIPLSSRNIGHQLLVKQGWEPGTILGLSTEGLAEPLDGETLSLGDRRGLGMPKK